MTKVVFAANWKMYKNPKETRDFMQVFKQEASKSDLGSSCGTPYTQIVFFPPATNLEALAQEVQGTSIQFGPQNCFPDSAGAFTGEISPKVAMEMGAKWILIGHSERRTLFGETDDFLKKKLKLVQELNLTPLLCIGETLQEREQGQTQTVLRRQLESVLPNVVDSQLKKASIAIAYEPVWAIGTGKVASLEQISDAHLFIRSVLNELGYNQDVLILYGGSVKKENAKDLMKVNEVSGFLVGGASLEVSSFLEICKVKK